MKVKTISFSVVFFLVLWACNAPVVFTEIQPQGFFPLEQISGFYQGVFYCEGDESKVYINRRLIYKQKVFTVGIPIIEIEESEDLSLENGELYIEGVVNPYDATIRDDTVFSEIVLRDTLFNMDLESNVLTEYKGHQILNRKLLNGVWEVIILSLKGNHDMVLSEALIPDDFARLEEITSVEHLSKDTTVIMLTPTVYEFEKILNEKLIFSACDHFLRIERPVSI